MNKPLFFDYWREDFQRLSSKSDPGSFDADTIAALQVENKKSNPAYLLAERIEKYIDGHGAEDDGSEDYCFFRCLMEELGRPLDTPKADLPKSVKISFPVRVGKPIRIKVDLFNPWIIIEDGKGQPLKRINPHWHYFVAWCKYIEIGRNNDSKFAELLRDRWPKVQKKTPESTYKNKAMIAWREAGLQQ